MILILLTFLAALTLESIGTIISVLGLISLFGVNELIIALAIGFDFAKIVTVSVLYKEWSKMPLLMKGYLTIASIVLMTITSTGAAGYLGKSFQEAILPTKSIDVKLVALEEEKGKLEKRKLEIDKQIANLPSDMVKGRTKLIANFKEELAHLNSRTIELDQEIPKLQVEAIDKKSHAGPITYISSAMGLSPEAAMGVIIGLIIFVFDPLAIVLILAGNYLLANRKEIPKKTFFDNFPQTLVVEKEPIDFNITSEPIQEELGEEFEKVLEENKWDLFDSSKEEAELKPMFEWDDNILEELKEYHTPENDIIEFEQLEEFEQLSHSTLNDVDISSLSDIPGETESKIKSVYEQSNLER